MCMYLEGIKKKNFKKIRSPPKKYFATWGEGQKVMEMSASNGFFLYLFYLVILEN